jgi:hypothetical protein
MLGRKHYVQRGERSYLGGAAVNGQSSGGGWRHPRDPQAAMDAAEVVAGEAQAKGSPQVLPL